MHYSVRTKPPKNDICFLECLLNIFETFPSYFISYKMFQPLWDIFVHKNEFVATNICQRTFKGMVSRDFEGIQLILIENDL